MALPEHLAEFERKVAARLADAVDEMRRSLHAQAERASSQLLTEIESFRPSMPETLLGEGDLAGLERPTRAESRGELAGELLSALAALDEAATQSAALDALLAAARGGADRAVVWLLRDDRLVGWGSSGFATNGVDPLAGTELRYDASAAAERLARGRGTVRLDRAEAAAVASELAIEAPHDAALVPIVLRDRLAAALYVDRLAGGAAGAEGALELGLAQLLAHATAQRLELQGLTARSFTPTLVLDEHAPADVVGLALWDAADAGESVSDEASSRPVMAAYAVADESLDDHAAGAAPAIARPESRSVDADEAFAPEPPTAFDEPVFELETSSDETVLIAGRTTPPPEVDDIYGEPAGDDATADLGHPALDAPPSERFVLEPPRPEPIETEVAAAEIGWEMADETSEVPTPADEASTGRVPFAASAPPSPRTPPTPAPPRVVRDDMPPLDATAEFAAPAPPAPPVFSVPPLVSPQATQAIRPGSLGTHEFAAPPAPPQAPESGDDFADDATVLVSRSSLSTLPGPSVASTAPSTPLTPPPAATSPVLPPVTPPAAPPPIAAPPAPSTAVAPPAASAVDDEPTISRGRTTEVAPPPDVQGPGWAFTATRAQRPTGDNALQEEARRLARLLISEIKLYNEEQVEEGRRNRDVYHRLKDDIDRSRQIYEERVHESVRGTTDYFQQELVRSLAGGDPRALGI